MYYLTTFIIYTFNAWDAEKGTVNNTGWGGKEAMADYITVVMWLDGGCQRLEAEQDVLRHPPRLIGGYC